MSTIPASPTNADSAEPFEEDGSGFWSIFDAVPAWGISVAVHIGVFLLLYGLWYPLKGNLWDYLAVTGTIYLSSISTLLIACCYWGRANSWGAAAAIICGAIFPSGFLVLEQLPSTASFAKQIGPYYSGIAAYAVAALAMVIGSLLKPQSSRVTERM